MKVFISWSGERSKAVAHALRDWLPKVIQAIDPWMSDTDIDKGSRWSSDISVILEEAKIGIICLTSENLEAPWILFEAGALSKSLDKTYVCPYLFHVESADIEGPLVQFQMTKANKDDTSKLVYTIYQALENTALTEIQLDETFEVWWPKFEQALINIPDYQTKRKPQRSEREILEEVLELTRRQAKFNEIIQQKSDLDILREKNLGLKFKLEELEQEPKSIDTYEMFRKLINQMKTSQSEKDKEND